MAPIDNNFRFSYILYANKRSLVNVQMTGDICDRHTVAWRLTRLGDTHLLRSGFLTQAMGDPPQCQVASAGGTGEKENDRHHQEYFIDSIKYKHHQGYFIYLVTSPTPLQTKQLVSC